MNICHSSIVSISYDRQWEEYHVKVKRDGRWVSSLTYFTDDKDDAISTALCFMEEEKKKSVELSFHSIIKGVTEKVNETFWNRKVQS